MTFDVTFKRLSAEAAEHILVQAESAELAASQVAANHPGSLVISSVEVES